MDHCASVLLAFPSDEALGDNDAYHKAAKSHLVKISHLFKDQGPAIASNAQNLLDCLNPEVNSISYLAILEVLVPVDPRQAQYQYDEGLAERIILFLRRFDARQIRYYGVAFTNLFSAVGSGQIMPAEIAVPLLAEALLKLDPSGSVLSSNHLTLMKLAYFSNVIEPALRVADKSIVYYPGMLNQPDPRSIVLCDPGLAPPSYVSKDTGLTTRLTPLQVLEYEWLSGLARCARHDWCGARTAFARAASHPSREGGVSRVMVEAYKRWVLVSLLDEGRLTGPSPPHTGTQAAKAYAALARPYVLVAEEFTNSTDGVGLKRCVETGQTQFVEDGNEGLMREVLEAHQKWQIVRLRDVYSRISLAEVRARTKSAVTGEPAASDSELAALVGGMVASGMLRAVIQPPPQGSTDGGGACLVFLPIEEETSEADVAKQIVESTGRIAKLGAAYQATKERLATSKEFIRQGLKDQKREKDNKDAGFDFNSIEDEDIMSEMTPGGH